jgi:hypothetical protein
LDAADDCKLSLSDGVLTVRDRGPGIPGDDQEVADLFSLGRAMSSSKFLRLPARGALGNGLRVVVGAVATTRGKLLVSTNGRTLEIIPDPETGRSTAIRVADLNGPGTQIELTLGHPLEITPPRPGPGGDRHRGGPVLGATISGQDVAALVWP